MVLDALITINLNWEKNHSGKIFLGKKKIEYKFMKILNCHFKAGPRTEVIFLPTSVTIFDYISVPDWLHMKYE